MNKILATLLILLGLTTTLQIKADEFCCYSTTPTTQGFYAGAFGGANWLNVDSINIAFVDDEGEIFTTRAHLELDTGYAVGGMAGYKFCPMLSSTYLSVSPRVEAEISYRDNKFSHIKVLGIKSKFGGHYHSLAFMANFFADINCNQYLTPYVGFGIGYAHSWFENSTSDRFAYQAIAGTNFTVCNNVDLCVDYRFLKAQKDANNQAVCFGVKAYF